MTPAGRAQAAFARHFGRVPKGTVFVPGRVNLIGEHVDYNDGLVLPMPISAGTAIAWSPRTDGAVRAVAADIDGGEDTFPLADPALPQPFDWGGYVRGMAALAPAQGLATGGADLAIAGSIPRGAGLSSSASLCVATGRALAAAAGHPDPAPVALALAAQAAEHVYAGVRCGIMDQLAVAAGSPGSAVLIDCRSLDVRQVALPPGWAVLIVQSGVSRGLVEGHYNRRRDECQAAAAALGVASLRDADTDMVEAVPLDPDIRARARHVVTEIVRTAQAVEAIADADIAALGRLFAASHASMRDDFAITVPPVDTLVAVLDDAIAGRGGARMTGGGFGGAVVAVVEAVDAPRVCDAVRARYSPPAGGLPEIMIERGGA